MTLLTLAAVVLFVQLGRWQWQRAQQTRALAEQFGSGGQQLLELGARPTSALPRYTQVRLQGSYDGEHQFLLDNMSHDGRPGYEVLTPLRLGDGRTASRQQLPQVQFDSAPAQTPTGRLDDLPVPGIALGHVAPAPAAPWPKLTSFPTIADLSAALGQPLQSRQLLLNPEQPFGYLRDWHPTGLGPTRHLSYAIQWWAFGALALVLYGYMNGRRASR